MKILITESQYNTLFTDLPNYLKRRLDKEDLDYFDKEIYYMIKVSSFDNDFKEFSYDVMASLMHNFVVTRKDSEIDTYINPAYGEMYDEDSVDMVFEIYWKLIPFFEDKYKDVLHQAWVKKGGKD